MANSSTEIANLALSLISDRRISNIDDTTDEDSVLCKQFFELALDETLLRVKPDAAHSEETLAQLTFTANEYQLSYRYALPESPDYCIKVLKANGRRIDRSGCKIIGRMILSNDETMFIEYLKRVTNYGLLPAPVVLAIAYNLAIMLTTPKRLSDAQAERLTAKYERIILPRAIAAENEQDGTEENISVDSSWETARHSVDRDLDPTYTYD